MLSERLVEITPRPATLFGVGLADRVGPLVRSRATRVLVVSDPGVLGAGVCDPVRRSLDAAGVEAVIFDGVTVNPTVECVELGAAAAAEAEAEAVVAVGGGAVLDAAKAVALAAVNDVPVRSLDYRTPGLAPGLPVLAVPTTAGTGSETNGFGVIADPDTGRKIYLGNDSVQPFAAVLDPLLTRRLPAAATAAAGMDALSHAVEALASRAANPFADALALEAARTVALFLPRAVDDGDDLEARSQVLVAAHLAGLAFASGTGLGLAHAVGHALSSLLGMPHGLALAVVLPDVMRFDAAVCGDRLARLPLVDGAPVGDAEAAADAVAALSRRVGTAVGLAAYGLEPATAARIVAHALEDPVILNTPRLPDADELERLVLGLTGAAVEP